MNISGEKLKRELNKRGLKPRDVSQEMGYAPNYLTQAAHSGILGAPAMKMLAMFYNIKEEDIAPGVEAVELFGNAHAIEELKRINGNISAANDTLENIEYTLDLIEKHLKALAADLLEGE